MVRCKRDLTSQSWQCPLPLSVGARPHKVRQWVGNLAININNTPFPAIVGAPSHRQVAIGLAGIGGVGGRILGRAKAQRAQVTATCGGGHGRRG